MQPLAFDTITKLFASRRAPDGGGVRRAADPVATPVPDIEQGPEMLFVQSFQSGSIAPTQGAEGRYTVTLEHGLGQTIFFSDRPERVVGASPTGRFLDGLGFPDDNPPNAALIVEDGNGENTIAVVELFNPRYDEASNTATYEAAVLENWEDSVDLGFETAPVDLSEIASTFDAAHLFIDGCPDGVITCLSKSGSAGDVSSSIFGGFCFSAADGDCLPCNPWLDSTAGAFAYWQNICNAEFPKCNGECEPLGVSRKGS
jgi:hypothetical protein